MRHTGKELNANRVVCFPDHKAGRVSLKVAQDGQIISNSPVFEFRDGSQPSSNPQPEPPVSAQTDWFDTSGEYSVCACYMTGLTPVVSTVFVHSVCACYMTGLTPVVSTVFVPAT